MKILHLIDSLDLGGAEKLLTDYISQLPEFEHLVVVFNGPRMYPIRGFQYLELNRTAPRNFFSIVSMLKKLINRENIDIIHSHSYWTNIISRVIYKKGIKLFNHYHFANYGAKKTWKNRMLIWMDQLTGKRELIRIAVSQYVKQILDQCFSGTHIEVIPNFIDCKQVSSKQVQPGEVLRIIAVGNFNHEKNYDLAIDCLQSLQGQPVELDIYGAGTLLERYRTHLQNNGINNVKLCGHYPDIPAKMKQYDLFLSTSLRESFGLVVLEAMCAGLPMILSDIPSFREIAPAGTTFFNPTDKNDLREKILKVVESLPQPDWQSYRERLNFFTLDNFVSRLRMIYLA